MSELKTTIREVIDRVDAKKSNAYSDDQKMEWINKVEGKIQEEIMGIASADMVTYTDLTTDEEKELLVGHPYLDIYDLYVEAMIDYYNKEYSSYENSVIMFNSVYADYSKFYERKNGSGSSAYVKNLW